MTEAEIRAEAEKLANEYWNGFEKLISHVARGFFIQGFKLGAETKRKRGKKS